MNAHILFSASYYHTHREFGGGVVQTGHAEAARILIDGVEFVSMPDSHAEAEKINAVAVRIIARCAGVRRLKLE